MDFHRPWGDPRRLSQAKLASLVDILEKRGDSYLSWAQSKDVEVYRAAEQTGRLRQGSGRPEAFEVDLSAQVSMANFFLLQQLIHVTSRSRKKFSGKRWPTPQTAADIVKQEKAEQGYHDLMAEIVFLEQDEFDRHIAEHKGDVIRKQIE